MKVVRIAIVLCVLVTATIAGAPARANHTYKPPVDRSPLPTLAGDTTVFGDRTAWMRVRLPKAIDSNALGWETDDLQIQGRGRLFGWLMVREVNGKIEPRAPSVNYLRSGMCSRPGCKPKPYAMISGGATERDGVLPAGIYRLYLLADGGPVRVHFSTRGLPGVIRLNPTKRPEGVKVHNLTPRVAAGDTGVIYSAGDKRPFRGPGFAFQAQWVNPAGAGLINRDLCWYDRKAPGDETTAYMPPACPVNLWWEVLTLPYSAYYPPFTDGYWEMHFGSDRLPKAMGSWYALTSPAEDYGAAALWLKVD